jgi:hypothetical protein
MGADVMNDGTDCRNVAASQGQDFSASASKPRSRKAESEPARLKPNGAAPRHP